jgi:hypothetical protein
MVLDEQNRLVGTAATYACCIDVNNKNYKYNYLH